MGHVLQAAPGEGEMDPETRREKRRESNSSFFVGCCYKPRKPAAEQTQMVQMPRYRVAYLTGSAHCDTDTDAESCISDFHGEGPKQVCFAQGDAEVTIHEWIEEGPEWDEARRSDDVDWANLSEKIAQVSRAGIVNARITLPSEYPHSHARRRARKRRESRELRKSLSRMSSMDSTESQSDNSPTNLPSIPEVDAQTELWPKWTKKDLEVWNPGHIKAVTLELFERHDIGKKGRLSWKDSEVMSFAQDFFRVHGCLPPQLPSLVFSAAYSQVKVESLPSHRDVDGLDMAETCEFARRVHNVLLDGEQHRSSSEPGPPSGPVVQNFQMLQEMPSGPSSPSSSSVPIPLAS